MRYNSSFQFKSMLLSLIWALHVYTVIGRKAGIELNVSLRTPFLYGYYFIEATSCSYIAFVRIPWIRCFSMLGSIVVKIVFLVMYHCWLKLLN